MLAGPAVAAGLALAGAAPAGAAERVTVTGEIIDSWCYISEIMYAEGTAHHLCALWCAAGGVPVGVLAEDGTVYFVLTFEGGERSVADPAVMRLQTHKVTVDGEFYRRDGLNYLLVDEVVADEGIVNVTHDDYGIQPFGE
jgi:hypothetical protein